MPTPGDKIGPYTLIRRLGQGTFGWVWLAEKRSAFLTLTVALKLPIDDDPDMDAIRHEAQVWLTASGHPNVLPVLDADVYDEQIVIVSEYAPDGTLQDWLKRHGGGAPSIESAVKMTVGILAGLQHLHSLNLIHRDLKPANVLLKGETPRLTDFGLTRVIKTTGSATQVSGTPAYMAPEMFEGRYSVQSDIWAAGIMLHRMLSSSLPIEASSLWEWAEAIRTRDPKPLPGFVPPAIQTVVWRALEKSPAARFRSAQEMLDALQQAAAQPWSDSAGLNQPVAPTPPVVAAPPTIPPPPPLPSPGERSSLQTPLFGSPSSVTPSTPSQSSMAPPPLFGSQSSMPSPPPSLSQSAWTPPPPTASQSSMAPPPLPSSGERSASPPPLPGAQSSLPSPPPPISQSSWGPPPVAGTQPAFSSPQGIPVAPAQNPPRKGKSCLVAAAIGGALLLTTVAALFFVGLNVDQREGVQCQSNIRQNMLGIKMYQQDYDDVSPPSLAWMDTITPYVRNDSANRCPAVSAGGLAYGSYGYAFNINLSYLSEAAVDRPAEMPAIYDSSTLQRNAADDFTSLPDPFRHNLDERNNVGFEDGHVKALDKEAQERAAARKPISVPVSPGG